LLLHLDSSFSDAVLPPKTVTANGCVSVVTPDPNLEPDHTAFGNAAQFDGDGDYIEVANVVIGQDENQNNIYEYDVVGRNFTFETWVNGTTSHLVKAEPPRQSFLMAFKR
ncbi:MAG: hypothetical protein QF687_08100, partial [Nitrospinaceae bacterium]|nr:hypothetical protein [Nitrospinaceae bacterium]